MPLVMTTPKGPEPHSSPGFCRRLLLFLFQSAENRVKGSNDIQQMGEETAKKAMLDCKFGLLFIGQ